jgi:hypothetical protein
MIGARIGAISGKPTTVEINASMATAETDRMAWTPD